MSIGVGRGGGGGGVGVDIGVLQTSHVLKKFCSDPNSLYHPTILHVLIVYKLKLYLV